MALAIAFDEARKSQFSDEGDEGGTVHTQFFGSRHTEDFPYAAFSQRKIGHGTRKVSRPHFHVVDQFQVVLGGKCKLGRHDIGAYGVHFSRAYTPYGPLVSDANTGFEFLVLRPRNDPGPQHLPEKKEELKQVPNRHPWQITRQVNFPALQSSAANADTALKPVADMTDELGLAAYTVSMKPNARVPAPSPCDGNGQYVVVVKGSLLHDAKEYNALALVFVGRHESPLQMHAGPEGLNALILNFPRSFNVGEQS